MKVENELKELSFQDLITVKHNVGKKRFDSLYKKVVNGTATATEESQSDEEQESLDESEDSSESDTAKGPKKRTDKNKPMEMSSKRPVSRKRIIVQSSKPVI
jgi:ribosomal RNA-processing protein 36